ncbi:hypothetical protein ACT80S_13235 [Ramlibacter sp. MAHUQ-53]|uniref:hypothetical protein n=1 Tax=unclassified Ramlibacter TaxID=2617605 RepID=UPI0036372A43
MAHTRPDPQAPDPGASPAAPGALPGIEEILVRLCARLGVGDAQAADIVASGCLNIEGVDFALRVNEANQHLEFFGDCGTPVPGEQADVFCHLLEEALSNDLPALCFARHPGSGHLVAKGSLALAGLDPDGWLLTALLVSCLTKIKALQGRFALLP